MAGLLVSLVFACLLTVIQVGDHVVPSWTPQFDARTPVTLRVPYGPRLIRNHATGRAHLHYEERSALVPRGTQLLAHVQSHQTARLFEMAHRPPAWPRVLGTFVIFFTLTWALMAYMRSVGEHRLRLFRTQAGLLGAMAAVAIGAKLLLLFTSLPALWIPTCVVPLFVAAVLGRRTAMVVVMLLSLVVSSLLQFDLVVLAVLLARGMIAVLCYWDRKHPRQMLSSGLVAGVCAAAFYLAIVVSLEGKFDLVADMLPPAGSQLLACAGGGLAAGVLGILLRLPAERLLGNVPRERLLELQDLSQPLLEKLLREAPGTFEHSRWMANLAEQAASAIGADALLTRVGAYYHDLGKTAQPEYFVENLERGKRSPHEDFDPDVSADAIMAHVVVGTRILRDGGIPEPVVEFAYTHHGTQLVSFFWNKCRKQGNPKSLTESDFRYPGMKPHTKETAIVMLVDSIEAASHTIDPPDREQFELMVQSIAFAKLRSGELDDCGLSLGELRVVANRVTDTLVNMNHQRIKYPWQAEQAEEFGVPARAVLPSSPEPEADPAEDSEAPKVDTDGEPPAALPLVRSKPPGPAEVEEAPEAPASSDADPQPSSDSPSPPAKAHSPGASDQRDV